MTNFDFLFGEKNFSSFAGACASAEKIFGIDTAACVVNVRRASELAVKWMYEHDSALPHPYRDQLAALTGASEFRALVGHAIIRSLDYIRRAGNNAAHNPDSVTRDQAQLALKNLYDFTVFIASRYSSVRPFAEYDRSLLDPEAELTTEAFHQEDILRLIAENRAMKRMLNLRSKAEPDPETPAPSAPISEADTRRLYIETALTHAGWKLGVNCFSEYPIEGIPTANSVGYADYVLCGPDGIPLALAEVQAAERDIALGRQQAKLYADALEKRFGHRPVIFLSSGYETSIWFDTEEPERTVGGFYSPADLLRTQSKFTNRRIPGKEDITALPRLRRYQKKAVRAVIRALCEQREHSVFLSMAPGTGKTRTALAAAELLYQNGWARHCLFLSENSLLAEQTYTEFQKMFPSRRAALLKDHGAAAESDVIFAVVEDLAAEADELTDAEGTPLLTAGYFDLIVCDETDSSLLHRYRELFSAFDAPLLALTSAPSDSFDPLLKNVLNLTSDSAVYTYSYEDAVRDGWISAFHASDVRLNLLTNGIRQDQLSPTEKRMYERLFTARGETPPEEILPEELFVDYFNADTVRLMLEYLRDHGHTRDGLPAKTIIFTQNHEHSEFIYKEYSRLFPSDPPHTCRVIDTTVNCVRSLIDDFLNMDSAPRIAVSHDLLFDGIDAPAVENLVFFTRAASRAVFWRMLGRGMRRCSKLPAKKPAFFVLDLCGNFETYENGLPHCFCEPLPVWNRNFIAKVTLAAETQSIAYSESCAPLRKTLVKELHRQIHSLNRGSFSVRRNLLELDRFKDLKSFDTLLPQDIGILTNTIAPLLPPDSTPESTALFNEQMYQLMLARLRRQSPQNAEHSILRTVRILAKLGTNKKIAAQKKLLNRILYNGYLRSAPVSELETVRRTMEPLIRYLPSSPALIDTNFLLRQNSE